MSIGKLIAQALQNALEDKDKGPEIELNSAAKASHAKHKAIIDELFPQYKMAKLELKRMENRVEEERMRWAIEMGAVQPELNGAEGFEINDEGTHFRVHLKEEEDDDKPLVVAGIQPDWAKELAKVKDKKPN